MSIKFQYNLLLNISSKIKLISDTSLFVTFTRNKDVKKESTSWNKEKKKESEVASSTLRNM